MSGSTMQPGTLPIPDPANVGPPAEDQSLPDNGGQHDHA
jgi:hypothetical protein